MNTKDLILDTCQKYRIDKRKLRDKSYLLKEIHTAYSEGNIEKANKLSLLRDMINQQDQKHPSYDVRG